MAQDGSQLRDVRLSGCDLSGHCRGFAGGADDTAERAFKHRHAEQRLDPYPPRVLKWAVNGHGDKSAAEDQCQRGEQQPLGHLVDAVANRGVLSWRGTPRAHEQDDARGDGACYAHRADFVQDLEEPSQGISVRRILRLRPAVCHFRDASAHESGERTQRSQAVDASNVRFKLRRQRVAVQRIASQEC